MNTLILTGYNDKMACIGDLTSPLMLSYAMKHGFGFMCRRDYGDVCHPSWMKVYFVHKALKALWYDRVIWLDADTLITNSDLLPPPDDLNAPPITASRDWGSDAASDAEFSMGNFSAINDDLGLNGHVWQQISGHKERWANEPLWEQSAMRELYAESTDRDRLFSVLPRRSLNAVHTELAPSAPEPWQPGDWLCHLTGEEITNEKRVAMFHKMKEELGL